MQDFEQSGAFYLGSGYDLAERKRRPELLLYDSLPKRSPSQRQLTGWKKSIAMHLALQAKAPGTSLDITNTEIAPRKADDVGTLTLVWLPFRSDVGGNPGYAFSLT